MSEVQPWFERKFDFTFPGEHFPNLCVRLRGAPPRLEEMVRDAQQERLTAKPDGKWSAQEHAGHLLDLEPLWSARVGNFLSDSVILAAADLTNQKTNEANHNARNLREILAEFRAVRLRLADWLDQLPPAAFARTLLHPRLKQPMRLVDHLYFVAEHDDHHLARIWKLIRS